MPRNPCFPRGLVRRLCLELLAAQHPRRSPCKPCPTRRRSTGTASTFPSTPASISTNSVARNGRPTIPSPPTSRWSVYAKLANDNQQFLWASSKMTPRPQSIPPVRLARPSAEGGRLLSACMNTRPSTAGRQTN